MKSKKLVLHILITMVLAFGISSNTVYADEAIASTEVNVTNNSTNTLETGNTEETDNTVETGNTLETDNTEETDNTLDTDNAEETDSTIETSSTLEADSTLETDNTEETGNILVTYNIEDTLVTSDINVDETATTDNKEISEEVDNSADTTDTDELVNEVTKKTTGESSKSDKKKEVKDQQVTESKANKETDVKKKKEEKSEKEKKSEDDKKAAEEKKEEAKYTKEELRLLASLIYSEAGNQPYKGKLAVANVVINRKNSKTFWHVNSIKEVIYDSKWGIQFSVIKKGSNGTSPLSRALDLYDSKDSRNDQEKKNMEECINAAKAALNGENNIGDYLYFSGNSSYLSKKFSNHFVIEDHIFYNTK